MTAILIQSQLIKLELYDTSNEANLISILDIISQ